MICASSTLASSEFMTAIMITPIQDSNNPSTKPIQGFPFCEPIIVETTVADNQITIIVILNSSFKIAIR